MIARDEPRMVISLAGQQSGASVLSVFPVQKEKELSQFLLFFFFYDRLNIFVLFLP